MLMHGRNDPNSARGYTGEGTVMHTVHRAADDDVTRIIAEIVNRLGYAPHSRQFGAVVDRHHAMRADG